MDLEEKEKCRDGENQSGKGHKRGVSINGNMRRKRLEGWQGREKGNGCNDRCKQVASEE